MLIHCLMVTLTGKQELVAFDREEGTAIYARTIDEGRLALTVGFTQPMSPVLRDRAKRRAIDRFVDDRKRFIKETRGLSAEWLER